eukprot:363309-Chlamydomonas_euryale.AAC.23
MAATSGTSRSRHTLTCSNARAACASLMAPAAQASSAGRCSACVAMRPALLPLVLVLAMLARVLLLLLCAVKWHGQAVAVAASGAARAASSPAGAHLRAALAPRIPAAAGLQATRARASRRALTVAVGWLAPAVPLPPQRWRAPSDTRSDDPAQATPPGVARSRDVS